MVSDDGGFDGGGGGFVGGGDDGGGFVVGGGDDGGGDVEKSWRKRVDFCWCLKKIELSVKSVKEAKRFLVEEK